MTFRCTATFVFPFTPFEGCGLGTTPGVIISIGPNIFWNLTANTNGNPFTNPMGFPIEDGDVICVNGSGEIVSHFPCTIESQFLVDGVPITNRFNACPAGGLTAELAQFLVNENIINPNATVTVTRLGTGETQAVVTIQDSGVHLTAQLQVFSEDVPVFMFDAPFVCTEVKKKSHFRPAFRPYIYIPVNDIPYIGRWNIECRDSGSNICCYAWSTGGIVGNVQCVSYRKSNSQYIEDAIAEAQARTPYPVIEPIESGNTTYYYDGVENGFYRFRHPGVPSALRPGSVLFGR